jgi:hypothetical protein
MLSVLVFVENVPEIFYNMEALTIIEDQKALFGLVSTIPSIRGFYSSGRGFRSVIRPASGA